MDITEIFGIEKFEGMCIGTHTPGHKDCLQCAVAARCREEKQKRITVVLEEDDASTYFIKVLGQKFTLEEPQEEGVVHVYKYEHRGVRVCVVKVSQETGRLMISCVGLDEPKVCDSFAIRDDADVSANFFIQKIMAWIKENIVENK